MYIEYNLNPNKKKVEDCAIRAVSAATGKSWDETYIGLANMGFDMKNVMSSADVVGKYLISLGFKQGKIKISKGENRIRVSEFATLYPNIYAVLRVANHFVATGKGNYIDIWDSGDCAIYKYWYKEIE